MPRINRKIFIVITGLSLIFLLDGKALIHSNTLENQTSANSVRATAPDLRTRDPLVRWSGPIVAFDHDLHTKAFEARQSRRLCSVPPAHGIRHSLDQPESRDIQISQGTV